MKTIRICVLLALAVNVAACDGIFGNDDDNFTFSAQRIEFTEDMANEAVITAGARTIAVDGIFLLPHPCYNLRGDLNRVQGAQLDVTITATPTNTCQPEIQAMDYRLQTLGFSRGPYRVRVYHEIQGQPRTLVNEEDLVLE
jgi:hypothetical protein